MSEDDAGQRLHLDVLQRRALMLGEIAHLLLRELDVVDRPVGELRQAIPDLRVGEAVILAVPAVELDRHLAHGGVAARGDVGENAFDDRADPGVLLGDGLRIASPFQPARHDRSFP